MLIAGTIAESVEKLPIELESEALEMVIRSQFSK